MTVVDLDRQLAEHKAQSRFATALSIAHPGEVELLDDYCDACDRAARAATSMRRYWRVRSVLIAIASVAAFAGLMWVCQLWR